MIEREAVAGAPCRDTSTDAAAFLEDHNLDTSSLKPPGRDQSGWTGTDHSDATWPRVAHGVMANRLHLPSVRGCGVAGATSGPASDVPGAILWVRRG